MENDKNNDNIRRVVSTVEIVDDVPPSKSFYDENALKIDDNVYEGTTILSKDDLRRLFEFRNLAFISTLSKDGSPNVTPVWAEMVDDIILVNTFETSTKNRNVTNDNRIAISVVEQNNPFNMVSIKGRVIEQTTKGADEHLKRLAKKYLGIGKYYYRKPNRNRVLLKIQPNKIMGISIHPAFYFLAYSPWNR